MRVVAATIVQRPYVIAFFAAGLWAAWRDLDHRGALASAAAAFGAGLAFDLASTRWGIPFGGYTYAQDTRDREAFIWNVPLYTPLSYVFLGWIAIGTARFARRGREGLATWALAAIVFVWIDVVVDPVTVRGSRWFLGEVFRYEAGGHYFGVPLSNFGGWLLLGTVVSLSYAMARRARASPSPRSALVVAGVLVFAVAVAASIQAWAIALAGLAWSLAFAAMVIRSSRGAECARLRAGGS